MPIKIKSSKAPAKVETEDQAVDTTTATDTKPEKKSPVKSFLKSGSKRRKLIEQESKRQDLLSSRYEGLRRFWVPDDKTATLTFLDGDLDQDGLLDIPVFYQHGIRRQTAKGTTMDFYVCTQDNEPCPLCEHDNPMLVGVLTVIEECEYESGEGELITNPKRLMVVTQRTLQKLQAIASEFGGLRHIRMDVSREGDKSPSVGNVFEPLLKYESDAELCEALGVANADPADYNEAIKYYTAKELATMGVADYTPPVGSEDHKAQAGGKAISAAFKKSL